MIADIDAGILGDIVPVADHIEEAWDRTIETSLKGILVVHEASDPASVLPDLYSTLIPAAAGRRRPRRDQSPPEPAEKPGRGSPSPGSRTKS